MNTTTNGSLFDVIDNLEQSARVAALRGIANSAMAKCIGAIRQHMRDLARKTRTEDESSYENGLRTDLDTRNEYDEHDRSADEVASAFGFTVAMPPIKEAGLLHAVYDRAYTDVRTLSNSRWDVPLTLDEMLGYMISKSKTLDANFAQTMADVIGTNVATITRMHELQAQRERDELIAAKPEIVMTFNNFGPNGYATDDHFGDSGNTEAFEELPKITQHQLGIKAVGALRKARDQVLTRVLRTRRISELAGVPLLEDGMEQVKKWVERFEHTYADEIREAIEAGRNMIVLEDVA